MLRAIDKGLATLTWVVAAVLALMLLIGPKVVADDKGKPPAGGSSPYAAPAGSAPSGKALFASNCGSCHTLSQAGTTGQVGPRLDGLGVDTLTVTAAMKAGPGVMPSFSLPPAETRAIASFVASASR